MTRKPQLFNNQEHSPIIPWVGGKRRLAKHIIPMFPEMRESFVGLHMDSVGITYSVGGGGKSGKVAELIIRNW